MKVADVHAVLTIDADCVKELVESIKTLDSRLSETRHDLIIGQLREVMNFVERWMDEGARMEALSKLEECQMIVSNYFNNPK